MGKANDERISIKSNNDVNINDHKGKANEERAVISNNNTNCKKNIVIVGDSIINNIETIILKCAPMEVQQHGHGGSH